MVESQPEILNHNVETVPRLQRPVRRRARWDRSVGVLTTGRRLAADIGHPMTTKTGLMVGLGESWDEVVEAMGMLREAEIDVLTIGQYLRPSRSHLPAGEVLHPGRIHGPAPDRARDGIRPRPVRARWSDPATTPPSRFRAATCGRRLS